MMKVMLSTIGKFHTFDLARELNKNGFLAGIYSGYPRFKLRSECLPQELIQTYPYMQTLYMGFPYWNVLGRRAKQEWEYWNRIMFDHNISKIIPICDVFSGLSGSALRTGQVVKSRGGIYVCDRGSSHIRIQDKILKEEHNRWGVPYWPIDPRIIEREEAEYTLADAITVPSTFVYRSFIACGIAPEKLHIIPYGVNLERFNQTIKPNPSRFDVLFVGGLTLRKGVPDLLEAFAKVSHPAKSLTMVGSFDPLFVEWLRKIKLLTDDVIIAGHMPQSKLKQIMSCSHVMVLPSLEEGLAMVQAQALACGCPVIASENTGAEDLFNDGVEGFIVPIRSSQTITEKLQKLANSFELRQIMSNAALKCVEHIGGWRVYGEKSTALFKKLIT